MRRDRRLHLSPGTRAHSEKAERELAALDGSVTAEAWAAMLPPLAGVLSRHATGASNSVPLFPEAGDSRFRRAFEGLASLFAGRSDPVHRDATFVVLESRVAREAGATADPLSCAKGLAVLVDWRAWEGFLTAVPVEALERRALDLMRLPVDETRWFDRFRRIGPGQLVGVFQDLDEQRAKTSHVGAWLFTVERYADEAHFGSEISVQSTLLERAGPLAWMTWGANLPHALLTAIAVDELSDLDVVEGLVGVCASVWAPPDARSIVTVLVVRRAIELLEQIDRTLASAASMQWAHPADDAARAEYAGWLEAWRKVELPSRLERLARLLAASGDGRTAVVVLMSHLRSIPPTNGRALPDVRAMLRERLLIELLERDVRVEALLTDGLTSAALLSGALWVLRAPSPDRVRVAVDAYRRWCCEDDVLWRAPLDTHEDDLIEALAKLFARLPSPTDEVEALLAAVTRPSQGWGFDLQRWFKSVPKVTHAVIVGAAAAHFCAIEGRGPEADRLIGLVWDHLQAWTRCSPLRFNDPRVLLATAYVWAFVAKIVGPDSGPRAALALAGMDDLWDVVTAAENYASNLTAVGVPLEVQRALRHSFEARLPIVAEHPHVTAEERERLRNTVHRLAADAYAEVARASAP